MRNGGMIKLEVNDFLAKHWLKLTELSRDNIRQKVYRLHPLFVCRFWKIEGVSQRVETAV